MLDPDQVLAAARALRELDLLQLLTRFDPQTWDADGVYPSGWSEGDAHAYLLPALQQLRDFLTTAARSGQAVVSAICDEAEWTGCPSSTSSAVPLTSRRPTWSPSTPPTGCCWTRRPRRSPSTPTACSPSGTPTAR